MQWLFAALTISAAFAKDVILMPASSGQKIRVLNTDLQLVEYNSNTSGIIWHLNYHGGAARLSNKTHYLADSKKHVATLIRGGPDLKAVSPVEHIRRIIAQSTPSDEESFQKNPHSRKSSSRKSRKRPHTASQETDNSPSSSGSTSSEQSTAEDNSAETTSRRQLTPIIRKSSLKSSLTHHSHSIPHKGNSHKDTLHEPSEDSTPSNSPTLLSFSRSGSLVHSKNLLDDFSSNLVPTNTPHDSLSYPEGTFSSLRDSLSPLSTAANSLQNSLLDLSQFNTPPAQSSLVPLTSPASPSNASALAAKEKVIVYEGIRTGYVLSLVPVFKNKLEKAIVIVSDGRCLTHSMEFRRCNFDNFWSLPAKFYWNIYPMTDTSILNFLADYIKSVHSQNKDVLDNQRVDLNSCNKVYPPEKICIQRDVPSENELCKPACKKKQPAGPMAITAQVPAPGEQPVRVTVDGVDVGAANRLTQASSIPISQPLSPAMTNGNGLEVRPGVPVAPPINITLDDGHFKITDSLQNALANAVS